MRFADQAWNLLRRRWLKGRRRGYRPFVKAGRDDHLRLELAFRECPGQWVAVDRQSGTVRAAAETPYALAAKLKNDRIADVDVIRAPAVGEPEVVGFG